MEKATDMLKNAIDRWPLDEEQRELILAGIDQVKGVDAEALAESLTGALELAREAVKDARATGLPSDVVRLAALMETPPSRNLEPELVLRRSLNWLGGADSESTRHYLLQLEKFTRWAQLRDSQLARRLGHLEQMAVFMQFKSARRMYFPGLGRRVGGIGLVVVGAMLGLAAPFIYSAILRAIEFFRP